MSNIGGKIGGKIGGSISRSISGSTPLIQVPPSGAVTLSDLNTVMASLNNGPGWIRDFRTSDGLFVDTGGVTPVVNPGDLIGRMNNQCTVTGSDAFFYSEATTGNKFQWQGNNGMSPATNLVASLADDTSFSPAGVTYGEICSVFAVKPQFNDVPYSIIGVKSSNSYFDLFFKSLGDGTWTVRPYVSQQVGEYIVSPDANGVFVVMMQFDPVVNTLEVYVNNVLIANDAAPGFVRGSAASTWISNSVVKDVSQEFMLGQCIAPAYLNEANRQVFCDYFQQNGGVL